MVVSVVEGGDVAIFDDGLFVTWRGLLRVCPVCFEVVLPTGHVTVYRVEVLLVSLILPWAHVAHAAFRKHLLYNRQ